MFTHDPYMLKAFEYLLGVLFLILFVAFWRYATGGRTAATANSRAHLPAPNNLLRVPDDVMLHPGHTWARVESPGVVAVGIDHFAEQLVGPIAAVGTPATGSVLEQGGRGWTLSADSRSVEVLAPISGRVVEVNHAALRDPRVLNADPYGRGWLMKLHVPRFVTASRQLLSGKAARHLMVSSWEELSPLMSPHLETNVHDGSLPEEGIARAIDQVHWDDVARRFLLSEARQN